MLYIFGDSHTRSFMNINNIIPFFLGPGKSYNLDNTKYKNIINKIELFFVKYKNININNDFFFLYFGEPNCRYLVNNNYHPFKINIKKWHTYEENKKKLIKIDKLILNYEKIINVIQKYTNNYFIITPTTGFFSSFYYLNYFNKLLKTKFNNKVINLYNNIFINNKINKLYLNDNLQFDPIHLNKNISKLFIEILINKNIINNKNLYYNSEKINKNFTKHSKFNTYII